MAEPLYPDKPVIPKLPPRSLPPEYQQRVLGIGEPVEPLKPPKARPTVPGPLSSLKSTIRERLKSLSTELELTSSKLPNQGEMIAGLIEKPSPAGFAPSTLRSFTEIGMPSLEFGGEEMGFPPREEEFIQFASEVDRINQDMYWAGWQLSVLDALPTWKTMKPDLSVEDVIGLSRQDGGISGEMRQFLERAIETTERHQESETEKARETLALLEKPGGSLRKLLQVNLNEKSASALVEQLMAAGRFALPETMTAAEARSMLVQMGMTEKEADDRIYSAAAEGFRLSQDLKAWDAKHKYLLDEGAKIQSGQILSAVRKAKWAQASTQPLILLLRPITYWLETVTHPIGGYAVEELLQSPSVPGGAQFSILRVPGWTVNKIISPIGLSPNWLLTGADEKRLKAYEDNLARAREEGRNSWSAHRVAFEEWDTNWINKFTIEVLADPITYAGFGLYTKVFSPIPLLSTGVRGFERGFVAAAELPFDVLKKGWTNLVPQTLQGAGKRAADATYDLVSLAVSKQLNIPIYKADPVVLRAAVKSMIEEAAENPQALDEWTRAGKGLMGYKAISVDEATELARALNVTGFKATPALMDNMNRVLELTDGFGITKFLQPEEAADLILQQTFGITADETSVTVVKGFLSAQKASMKAAALRPFEAATVREQLVGMSNRLQSSFVSAQKTQIATKRYQQGLVASMLNGLDTATRFSYISTIDRAITQRFARAYLVFGFYGVMNVVEGAMKTMLAGISPIWRGDPYQRAQFLHHGIRGHVPSNILSAQPFNLGLGMPEEELRILSTAGARREAKAGSRNIVRRYVYAFNQGRLLRTLGFDLKQVTGTNWGNRLTGAELSNYQNAMLLRQITERAPEVVQAVADLIKLETQNLNKVMSAKMADSYREALFSAVLSGDDKFLRNVPEVFTPGKVRRAEAEKVLDAYMELPSDLIDNLVTQVEDGRLWEAGGINKASIIGRERIYEHYFSSPEVFESTFKDIVEAILEEVPRTEAEFVEKVNLLHHTSETFENTVSNTMRAVVEYSRTLRTSEESSSFMNDYLLTRLSPQMNRVNIGLEDAIKDLKRQFGVADFAQDLEPGLRDQYNLLLDTEFRKVEVFRRARLEYGVARDDFMRPSGSRYVKPSERDNDWWTDFLAATKQPWDDARNEIITTNRDILSTSLNISKQELQVPADLSRRVITRLDVARLYGVHSMDLERNMYLTDTMGLWGRDAFVDQTLQRAELGAARIGSTSETLGWTRETIGRVYDDMVKKLRSDPKVETGTEPMMQQLQAAMEDLTHLGFRRQAIITDNAMDEVRDSIERIAGKIFPREGKALRLTGEQEVRFIPRVRATQFEVTEPVAALPAEVVPITPIPTEEAAARVPGLTPDEVTELSSLKGRLAEVVALPPSTHPNRLNRVADDIIRSDQRKQLRKEIAELEARQVAEVAPTVAAPVPTADDLGLIKERSVYYPKDRLGEADITLSPVHRVTIDGQDRYITSLDYSDTGLGKNWYEYTGEGTELPGRGGTGIYTKKEMVAKLELDAAAARATTAADVPVTAAEQVTEEAVTQVSQRTRALEVLRRPQKALPSAEGIIQEQTERFIATMARERAEITAAAQAVQEVKTAIRGMSGRRVNAAEIRLSRLNEMGIDIRVAEAELNNFSAYRDLGNAKNIRTQRTRFWTRFLKSLDTLDVDVEATMARTEERLKRGFVPGQENFGTRTETVKELMGPSGIEMTFERQVLRTFSSRPDLRDANLQRLATDDWQAVRADALSETNRRRAMDFPDYDNQTALSSAMKMIYPFWGYEAHRWAWWLPREMLRHPGVWAGWGKYQNNTDLGYVHIPGTSLDINVGRGSIFMGGMRRLAMRDFPEYYDQFEGTAEWMDNFSRWGFYPGFPISFFMSTFGAKTGTREWGELVPPTGRTVLGAISAISPERGRVLREVFFPDRFRDYLTSLEVSRLDFDKETGFDGPTILRKKIQGESLTDEEDAIWLRASRGIGMWQVLFEQTGLFRLLPEEKITVWREANLIMEEESGVPVAVLEDLKRYGLQFEDVFQALSPETQQALNALDKWRRFTGAAIGLLPSEEGKSKAQIREYWVAVQEKVEESKEGLLKVQSRFEAGQATYSDWEFAFKDKVQAIQSIMEDLKRTDKFAHVPVTMEQRLKLAEETGIKLFFHPLEEMRELYFRRELGEVWDIDQQRFVPDFDGYYLHREVLEQSLPDGQAQRLQELLRRSDSPLESLRYKISRDYFRAYDGIRDAVLSEFKPEEQAIIRKNFVARGDVRAELRAQVFEGSETDKIIAEFEKRVRRVRSNLREVDPWLDAWLLFFEKTKTAKTPTGNKIYNNLIRTLNESGVQALISQ